MRLYLENNAMVSTRDAKFHEDVFPRRSSNAVDLAEGFSEVHDLELHLTVPQKRILPEPDPSREERAR